MKCAQAQKLIKPFLDHVLPDHELAQFLEHVRSCPDCYDELGIYLAIGETLKNEDENEDPDDFDFRRRLQKEIRESENLLRIHRSQAWIRRGLVLSAVLILGLLVYTGFSQMRDPELPAWETELEEPSESVMETAGMEEPSESVMETAGMEEPSESVMETAGMEEPSEPVMETAGMEKPSETVMETAGTEKPPETVMEAAGAGAPSEAAAETAVTEKISKASGTAAEASSEQESSKAKRKARRRKKNKG